MAKPKIGEEIELQIDSPAFGGYGIARHEGIVVFVRYAYPGERVIARITKRKRTTIFAEQVAVLEASPARRKPPCPAFGKCGGCAMQDIEYEEQFKIKIDIVKDCLEYIGKLHDLPDFELIPADREFRYRNKMELSFGMGETGMFLGLHVRGRFDRLVPARDCLIMPDYALQIVSVVEEAVNSMGLDIYNQYSDDGLLRHLSMRFSETEGKCLLGLTMRFDEPAIAIDVFQYVAERCDRVAGVAMVINSTTGDTAQGEKVHLFGSDFIGEEMLGLHFRISLESFFQTNTRMARLFYSKIADFAGDGALAFDLFSGTGTISQILSPNFTNIVAIESVERAVKDARISAERNGISNTEFIHGKVENELSEALSSASPDVVVFDPPRNGVPKRSLEAIIATGPKRIVYASCNPSTLARDLNMLDALYSIDRIAIVDMFPQTHHIETIVRLSLR